MPWFKVDDGLPSSRKVLGIPRRDRLAAIGLWTLAGAWSAKELQDGAVPTYMIVELGATRRVAEALVTAGLWSRTSSGYSFVNWDEFQPTKADVLSAREKNAEKLRKWRQRNRARDEGETESVTGLQPGSKEVRNPAPVPTRPDPTSSPNGEEKTTPRKRGTRLDEHWVPEDDLIAQMRVECPSVDLRAEHRVFVDYWIAQPGQKGVKTDWPATWRNWMRRKAGDGRPGRAAPPSRGQQRDAELMAFMTEHDPTTMRQEITS
ncbi:hypothetical protein [Curtobacterium sp. DN_7.5]|uniref:hypothetical protein n=1 Tax=Curtobacterium sp. DN_7.5 TaxID=3049047 RepID=UPI001F5A2B63|nr:hypothetical protein [Curtobacterium sp. DN_7.5]